MLTTLPPSCADVMKSGNLNFLEFSGPPQACNGTALTLLFTICLFIIFECLQTQSIKQGVSQGGMTYESFPLCYTQLYRVYRVYINYIQQNSSFVFKLLSFI